MDPQNLMTTLQQLSNLSGANLTSQMGLSQFGNDLSSIPWASGHQAWLDSAKMAAMYNIIQTANVNDQVQQSLNNINAMNSIEQSLKLLAQQTNAASLPQSQPNIDQLATTQSTFQSQLAMLQNDALSSFIQNNLQQQQQQVSTPSTSTKETPSIDTNLAQLLQHSTSTAEINHAKISTWNLQNTMSILGLSSSGASSSLPQNTTEQEIFNAATNHLNNIQGQVDHLQGLYSKPTKKSSKETQRKTSQQSATNQLQNINETANQTLLLSRISQNNLLAVNPNFEHTYLPSTSSNPHPSTTLTNKPSNGLTIDDFDLNDINEIFLDKSKQKVSTNKQPQIVPTTAIESDLKPQIQTTTLSNDSTQQKHANELNMDLDHLASNNEFDFDFNETIIEKSFDPLKFLNEMTVGTARDSPEPGFNQAELEPVQFTPPDSPQHHQHQQTLKIDSHIQSTSMSVATKISPNLLSKQLEMQKPSISGFLLTSNLPSTNQVTPPKLVKPEQKSSMPLMFIPPVKESALSKKSSINQTDRKSTLLQQSNKVPIYKQKFVNLTSNVSEPKGEDCYSFIDDEFELPVVPKASTINAQKEHESASKTTEKAEKHTTSSVPSTSRRVPQVKEHHRESKPYVGTPWSKEYLNRMEKDPLWISVHPFEYTDIHTDKSSPNLSWTADRPTVPKKNSLRVVIKEEPVASNSEEAPRPRLVLKFIKPKEDEMVLNEEQVHVSNHKRRHSSSSKKHKKHKKKERDTEWEYPGQPKRHKKKHKHHHHHKVKSEELSEQGESNPAFNTRSALFVKTESDHTSPSHSNHSFSSVKQEFPPFPHHKSSTSNDILSSTGNKLMDDQFVKRYNSFSDTQNDLSKGVFVVAKEDLWQEECPLWRIDSQNLLQKFVPCHENPGCYTNTSNYTGWCEEISDNYIIIHVEFLKHSRAETIVKPLHSLDTLFPAVPTEDLSICCVDDEQKLVDNIHSKNGRVQMVESVIELLLKQCANSITLEEAHKQPESRAIRALNEFQQRCAQCIEEIQVEEMVRRDIQMLLDHYNGFITFDNYSDGDECLCCGQEEQLIRVGLHGDVKYDPNLLIIQDTVDEETFGHSMDIAVCQKCADQLKFYHRNRHALFHLYKKCENQFIDLALEKPTATANVLLNLALKDNVFIQKNTNDILKVWNQLSSMMEQTASGST